MRPIHILWTGIVIVVTVLWLGLLSITLEPWFAPDKPAQIGEEAASNPLAPVDTSSPQASLKSLIDNVSAAYQEIEGVVDAYDQGRFVPAEDVPTKTARAKQALDRAIQSLNLSEVPPISKQDVGIETVLQLKEISDRLELPDMAEVPGATEIEAMALEPQDQYRWRIPGSQLEIVRVTEGPRTGEYLFSPQTVKRVPSDYEKIRHLPYQPGASEGFYEFYSMTPGHIVPPRWTTWLLLLPDWAFTSYGDETVWQWTVMILTILLVIITVIGVYRLSRLIKPSGPLSKMLLKILTPLIAILTTALAGEFIDEQINITGDVLAFMRQFETIINFLMISWVVWITANGISAWYLNSAKTKRMGLDASLVRVMFRTSAAIIILMVISSGLNRLGVPVVAILTGLGLVGLALSLALSSTLEHLVSGFSLYADRPVRTGDLCRYGDQEGFIEEIGIRSVKIRGWDRTVTTIQNADFVKMQITNISRLNYRLLEVILNLRSETTPEQLRYVLVKIRELLFAHPAMMLDNPARVRFMGFGDYSLDIEVFAYANVTDLNEFLAIKEDVLLRIMDIVDEAGTELATPAQITYLAQDDGLATERGQAAEAQVQSWRESGKLPFPEFSEEHRQQIENTLDYPPTGSSGTENRGGKDEKI